MLDAYLELLGAFNNGVALVAAHIIGGFWATAVATLVVGILTNLVWVKYVNDGEGDYPKWLKAVDGFFTLVFRLGCRKPAPKREVFYLGYLGDLEYDNAMSSWLGRGIGGFFTLLVSSPIVIWVLNNYLMYGVIALSVWGSMWTSRAVVRHAKRITRLEKAQETNTKEEKNNA